MHLSLAVLAIASVVAAQSQYQWTELLLSSRPFARDQHAMVYDVARGVTVLFGGNNGAYMNDTWTLDGNGWTRRQVSPAPGARANHAMAYDPVRQRVVLLGGYDGSNLRDIWEWDGTAWAQVAANVAGLGGYGSACYDPLQGGVFYNLASVNLLWDGLSARTVTVAQPNGFANHAMVFDAAAAGALMTAGQDTYVFRDPQGWQVASSNQVFSLSGYALAIDPAHHRVIMNGGDGAVGNSSGNGFRETWLYTGTNWSLVSSVVPGGNGVSRHAMVFDVQRDAFVMFGGTRNGGGLTDRTCAMHVLTAPASYSTFGSGCAGSAPAAPRLQADPLWSSTPTLGGAFFALVDRLPAGQLSFGFFGLSNQVWNNQSLPLDLTALGMPQCSLLVDPAVSLWLGQASSAGSCAWLTSVPAQQGLLGVEFWQQAAVMVPGANSAGVLWSNAGHGVIGLR